MEGRVNKLATVIDSSCTQDKSEMAIATGPLAQIAVNFQDSNNKN
jgi:hypothetical protein